MACFYVAIKWMEEGGEQAGMQRMCGGRGGLLGKRSGVLINRSSCISVVFCCSDEVKVITHDVKYLYLRNVYKRTDKREVNLFQFFFLVYGIKVWGRVHIHD